MKNANRKGFTLIELLIVIAIIGILAAVLIPNLLAARTRANDTAALSCARAIATAQEIRQIDLNAYGADLTELDAGVVGVCNQANINENVTPAYVVGAGWAVWHTNGSVTHTVSPAGITTATGLPAAP